MAKSFRITNRSVEYSNPWFDVVAKDVSDGSPETSRFYMIRPADYVLVIAETDAQELLFVRQYRPAMEDFTLEFPSGHVEKGEEPQVTAARELLEETGYEAATLGHLGTLAPDTGRMVNRLWCYFARARRAVHRPPAEEGVDMVSYPRSHINELVSSGKLIHTHDLAAIALAYSKKYWTTTYA